MNRFLRLLFDRHYFSERILFLAIGGGLLLDGWLTAAFRSWSAETSLRVLVSLLSFSALAYTYNPQASRVIVRRLAYVAVLLLVSLTAFLDVAHRFDNDSTITFIAAYVICSLYFRSMRELVYYLLFGFTLAVTGIAITKNPEVVPQLFLLRLFIGGLLVLSLSFATRQFQKQLQQFSKRLSEENRSLNETRIALEERLTHEHLLALVASRVNAAVIISDPDDRIEWVNDGFCKMTGYNAEEVVGQTPEFFRGPQTDPVTVERIRKKIESHEPFHDTILNYRKDGSAVWIQMHVTPLLNEAGELERIIAIQEDITEIKDTEENLRRSQEQLKMAQHQAKIGSWEWIDRSQVVSCSEEMSRILGLEGWKQAPVQLIMDRVHPGDLGVLRKSIENGLRRRSPFEMDFRLVIDGNVKYVYLTGQAVSTKQDRTERLFGTLQDITERKQIENEMRLAEKQYRSLFEHSQHMICIHDLQGNILSINPAGAHAVGFEPEEIVGRAIKTFFWFDDPEEYTRYMSAIAHDGQASGLLKLRHRDDTNTVWLYNNILLSGPDGSPYVLSSNVEITSRFEMEKELRQAKRIAEEALVMKDRFVANISHELRTPMNAIIGFTDLLLKMELTPEQREYLQAVHAAGDNLTSMINDVLDLAKIEAGKIEFEAKPFSVRDVMSNTHRLLSQTAVQSGLSFDWECAEAVPVYVLGDELRLTQILINLVGNALKFTEKGFVHFACTVRSETSESLELEFLVEDSGIGIPEEKVPTIFEPFTQGSAESTRKYGGTGLGLSIVRDLAELQGGTVSVKSAEGIGSAFTVTLPVKKVSVEVIQQVEQALQPVESPGNIRVLLVEDQPLNQKLAKKIISDFGFTTEIAVNGKSAIDLLRNETFDIVLMDLQMPEVDGYDATRIIREKLKLDIPIIALTAHSSAGEREKCLSLGMNDYLAKPYRAQELYFKIASAVRKKVNGNIPAEEIHPDTNPLRSLAAGDKKFEMEMIQMLLKSIPEDFNAIVDAIRANDLKKAKTTAHRLKSSVALAGEKEFAEQLEQVEKTALEESDTQQLLNRLEQMHGKRKALMDRLENDYRELEVA